MKEIQIGKYPNTGYGALVGGKSWRVWCPFFISGFEKTSILKCVFANESDFSAPLPFNFNGGFGLGMKVYNSIPSFGIVATPTAGGSNLDASAVYKYKAVFNYGSQGTLPSTEVSATTGAAGGNRKITISWDILTNANGLTGLTSIDWYRTEGGSTTFYYHSSTTDFSTTSFIDDTADSSISSNQTEPTQSAVYDLEYPTQDPERLLTANDKLLLIVLITDEDLDPNLGVKRVIVENPIQNVEESQNDGVSQLNHAAGTELSDIINFEGYLGSTAYLTITASTANKVIVTFQHPGYVTNPSGTAIDYTSETGFIDITRLLVNEDECVCDSAMGTRSWPVVLPYGYKWKDIRCKQVYTVPVTAANSVNLSTIKG